MAAIGQFGVKAVVDIDWDAELAEGTDGALCDCTGALKPELRVNAVEVQAMYDSLEAFLLTRDDLFTEFYTEGEDFMNRNKRFVHKIIKLIDPRFLDPNNADALFRHKPRIPPMALDTADQRQLARDDARERFQTANAAFFNIVLDNKDKYRAAMAALPEEFPGLKKPAAAAAGDSSSSSPARASPISSKTRALTAGEQAKASSGLYIDDQWSRRCLKSNTRLAAAFAKAADDDTSGLIAILEHFDTRDWLPLVAGLTRKAREPDNYGLNDKSLFNVASLLRSRDAELAQFISERIAPSGDDDDIAKRWAHALVFPGPDAAAVEKANDPTRKITT